MAMKKSAMTPTQVFDAGYVVEAYCPIGSNSETRKRPWIVRRRYGGNVLERYATRHEAVAALYEEMTDPDGTLRPEEH